MKKQITFRGMDHSNAMEGYINEQLAKVESFLEHEKEPVWIHLTLDAERTHHHHKVELQVKSPNFDLFCEYEDADMYDAIDRVIDTMYKLLREKNKELNEKRHTGAVKRK